MLRGDLAVAAVLAAVGAGFWLHLRSGPVGQPLFGITPGSLPTGLAALIAVMGALLVAVLALRRAPAAAPDPEAAGLPGALRLAGLIVLCLGFAVGLREVGFLLAGGGLVLGTALLFGARAWLVLLALTLAAPWLLAQFFEQAMVIYLPVGRVWQ